MWSNGIKKELDLSDVYSFSLNGNPWFPKYKYETVASRALVGNLISYFSKNKWNLYATCILTRSVSRKSSFFFRYYEEKPSRIHCISLRQVDKIRFIGNHEMVVDKIRIVINQSWKKGIQEEKQYCRRC